jgi:hypothetical protein
MLKFFFTDQPETTCILVVQITSFGNMKIQQVDFFQHHSKYQKPKYGERKNQCIIISPGTKANDQHTQYWPADGKEFPEFILQPSKLPCGNPACS